MKETPDWKLLKPQYNKMKEANVPFSHKCNILGAVDNFGVMAILHVKYSQLRDVLVVNMDTFTYRGRARSDCNIFGCFTGSVDQLMAFAAGVLSI